MRWPGAKPTISRRLEWRTRRARPSAATSCSVVSGELQTLRLFPARVIATITPEGRIVVYQISFPLDDHPTPRMPWRNSLAMLRAGGPIRR